MKECLKIYLKTLKTEQVHPLKLWDVSNYSDSSPVSPVGDFVISLGTFDKFKLSNPHV